MHALVVTVTLEPGRDAEALAYLQSDVVPGVQQIPGLVSAYWLAPRDGQGLSVLLFESKEAAQAAAAGLPNVPRADFATLGTVEVREVLAQL